MNILFPPWLGFITIKADNHGNPAIVSIMVFSEASMALQMSIEIQCGIWSVVSH